MSKVNGLAALVEEERADDEAPAAPAVQLVLGSAYGVPVNGSQGPIPLAPDDAEDGGELVQGERRVGRPPGRRNKSTEAWRRFILGQHGSPLQALARIYASDPAELAAALGIKRSEAIGHIITAARVAAPYLHSVMPTDVRLEGKGAFGFAVFTGGRPGDRGDIVSDDLDPLVALEKLSNQSLSDAEVEQSNDGQSNAPPEGEADQ